jgi:hypothetical protein
MDKQTSRPPEQQDKDMDLAALLSLISRGIRKLFLWIASVFVFLFECLLALMLFIKRKFIFLLIGAVIGFGYGLYAYYSSGPLYYADMVVRTNFESSRLLYNKIKYFNALIREQKTKELSNLFGLSEEDTKALKSFTIEPISDELEKARIYKEDFLTHDRSTNFSMDTMWSNSMKYKDFKENLTTYDYPFHEIRLLSSSSSIYNRISAGIVKSIQENATLRAVKTATDSLMKQQEQIISSSLASLDSLKTAYNRRISSSATPGKGEGQNFIFSDKDSRNPEIDLYDKELLLKDELGSLRRKQIEQSEILQVYSDFNEVGTPYSLFRQPFVRLPLYTTALVFIILVLIEFVKGLNKVEKNKKIKAAKGLG